MHDSLIRWVREQTETWDLVTADIWEELSRRDTEHPVFHGAWDWHSAVHGHWALLTLAQIRGDHATRSRVLERLNQADLAKEFENLRLNPSFEAPYGRAWLLRLMMTLESVRQEPVLRECSDTIAHGLMHRLERKPQWDAREYESPLWVMVQLQAWAEWTGDPNMARTLNRKAASLASHPYASLSRDVEHPGDFFSYWSLRALVVLKVLGADAFSQWLGSQSLEQGVLEPISDFGSAHHLAINASRAWGFAATAQATGKSCFEAAYMAHLQATLQLHHRKRHDRIAYTHWVPQFTIYALAEGIGLNQGFSDGSPGLTAGRGKPSMKK